MENPIKMDDLGVSLFSETAKWWFLLDDKNHPFPLASVALELLHPGAGLDHSLNA